MNLAGKEFPGNGVPGSILIFDVGADYTCICL